MEILIQMLRIMSNLKVLSIQEEQTDGQTRFIIQIRVLLHEKGILKTCTQSLYPSLYRGEGGGKGFTNTHTHMHTHTHTERERERERVSVTKFKSIATSVN